MSWAWFGGAAEAQQSAGGGIVERAAALDGVGAVAVAGQRALLRQASFDAIAAISVSGSAVAIVERSVALDATATVAVSGGSGPFPTYRGSVESGASGTVYTLTPDSTPTGAVALHIASTVSSGIVPAPTITGFGTGIAWTLKLKGMRDGTRSSFIFEGIGTFDGSNGTITFGSTVDECIAHLIDWSGAKPSKPFIKFWETQSGSVNGTSMTLHQQRRVHANNALGAFANHGLGSGDTGNVIDEGAELRDTVIEPGAVMVPVSFWNASDFTGFDVGVSWDDSASSAGLMYEVQAPVSDDGPTASARHILAGHDTGGDVDTGSLGTLDANEVVVFAAVTERAADSQEFTSVVDDSANAYSLVGAVNVDADHRLHVWAFRYGASPPSATTLTADHPAILAGSVYWVVGLQDTQGTTNTDWCATPVTDTAAAATSIAATLTGMGSHGGALAFVGRDASTEDFLVEDGFVPFGRDDIAGRGNETECIIALWNGGDEDNTPSVTCSSGDLAIAAFEVLGVTPGTTFERSAAIDGAGDVSASGTFFSVFARSAAADGVAAITVDHERELHRQILVDGAGAVTVSGQRDVQRSASLDATAVITADGERDVLRSVALSATATVEVVSQRAIQRSVTLDGAGTITVTGQIEGGIVTHERAAALSATAAVTVDGHGVVARSAALGATAAVTAAGIGVLARQAAISALAAITVAGEQDSQRAAALNALGTITVSGQKELHRFVGIGAVATITVQGQLFALDAVTPPHPTHNDAAFTGAVHNEGVFNGSVNNEAALVGAVHNEVS